MDDVLDIGKSPSIISPAELAERGKKALVSGAISPGEAQAAAKKLGLDNPEGAQDWLSGHLGLKNDNHNPYLFGPQDPGSPTPMLDPSKLPNPAGVKPGQRNAQIKSQQTASQENKEVKTRISTDGAQDIISMVRDLPEVQQQRQGVEQLAAQLATVQSKSAPHDSWVKPLLALADSQTGGKQAQSFESGTEKREATLEKYANDLALRRGDLSKTMLDSIAKMKTGTDQTTNDRKFNELLMMGIGNGQNGALSDVRRNNAISAAGGAYDKDTLLKQMENTNNSLNRAVSMMDGKAPITGKNFALLQQDMINAMAQGGAATEGKVNREMVDTLQAKLNDLQLYFGKVKDLRKEQPELFGQLKTLISQIKGDYSGAYKKRAGDIKKNYDNVTDELIKKAAYDKYDHLIAGIDAPSSQGSAQASGNSKKLEDMSNEEIDALHKKVVK